MSGPLFRKPRTRLSLGPKECERQSRAVRSAQAALGSIEAIRAFLNTHHARLAGRPMDLAAASERGLIAVEAALAAEARTDLAGLARIPEAPRAEILI
jgi:regulator of sirC expression with transglutaminase-like and TPR domain